MNILLNLENRVFRNLQKPLYRLSREPLNRFISQSRPSSNSSVCHNLLVKPTVLVVRRLPANLSLFTRSAHKSVFDINTNVTKDVLLYQLKSGFFFSLNFLLVGQLVTWFSFAYLFVRALQLVSDEDLQGVRVLDLTQKKWQIIIPSSFVFAGKLSLHYFRCYNFMRLGYRYESLSTYHVAFLKIEIEK